MSFQTIPSKSVVNVHLWRTKCHTPHIKIYYRQCFCWYIKPKLSFQLLTKIAEIPSYPRSAHLPSSQVGLTHRQRLPCGIPHPCLFTGMPAIFQCNCTSMEFQAYPLFFFLYVKLGVKSPPKTKQWLGSGWRLLFGAARWILKIVSEDFLPLWLLG